MENVWPVAAFVFLALVSVAAIYAAYLREQGDPEGDALYAKVEWVVNLVKAAEQTLSKQPGATRFQWVFEQLRRRFPDIEEGDARILIESAVHDVNAAKEFSRASDTIDDQGGQYWIGSGRQN